MIEQATRDTIDFLIRRYRLHDRLPVDLTLLVDRFTVRPYDFTRVTLGFSVVLPRNIHIGINKNLDVEWRRMALAHEISHIIAYHPHRLYTCRANIWHKDPHEHEAQMGAAMLLVPVNAVRTYYDEFTPHKLAKLLQVPIGLVDLRWSQAKASGEI